MSNIPATESELQHYVDGRLPSERKAAVAVWLAQHPEENERIAAYRCQRDALRAALVSVTEEPLPPELDLRLRPAPPYHPSARYLAIAASVALIFLLGGGTGWMLRAISVPPAVGTAALAREAVASYAVYAGDAERPVELAAVDLQEMNEWFSRRLSRPIKAPDLTAAGFELIGSRLVATDHGPAGLYLYRDGAGARVALYVRPMRVDGTDRMTRRNEGNVTGWTWADDGLGFGVFGTMSDSHLHNTANMVRSQFRRV